MKKVTLFAFNRCPHCDAAKQYFESKNIPFRLVNVSTPRGQKELASLGARSVPVIRIGDEIVRGFSVKQIEKVLKAS
ncbi:glutaredoxin family protein [Parasalinivibrio latis]|uniref:glutaredoxin family protein n=1 Tax=Parasalinivibrio latis TaxID=2952610 RepID=UPI0030DFB7A1